MTEEDIFAQRVRAIAALVSVCITAYALYRGLNDPFEKQLGHHSGDRFPSSGLGQQLNDGNAGS